MGIFIFLRFSTIFKKENVAENICENVTCMTYDILMIRGYNYIIYPNLLMFFNWGSMGKFSDPPCPTPNM